MYLIILFFIKVQTNDYEGRARTTYGPRVHGTGRWYSCDKVAAVSRQEEIIADNAHLGTLPVYTRIPYSWQRTSVKSSRRSLLVDKRPNLMSTYHV